MAQTELKRQNAELALQNKHFMSYEHIALTALANADAALQDREAAVEQREQYKPAARSFLPPRSE